MSAGPFTRLISPDPTTQRIVQDLYDKLAQLQQTISSLNSQISQLSQRITKLGG